MSLIAWYPLNGNTNDYSGNNVLTTVTSPLFIDSGKIGKCLSSGSINLPAGLLNNNTQSICMWYYNTEAVSSTTGSHQITGGAVRRYALFAYPNNNDLHYSFYDDVLGVNAITGVINNGLPCLTWTHVTLVNNNGVCSIYLNGVFNSSFSTAGWVRDFNNSVYDLIQSSSYHRINDVRVYDHALSEKEIKEIAKAKILHYTFDDFQEPTTNIIIDGMTPATSSAYNIKDYYFREAMIEGETYTVSMKAKLGSGKIYFGLYNSGGSVNFVNLFDGDKGTDGVFRKTFIGQVGASTNTYVRVYHMSSETVVSSTIEWLCIEKKSYFTPETDTKRLGVIYDSSGFRNNAILTEATTPQWVNEGKIGSGSYKFNRPLDYIQMGYPGSFSDFTNCTISFWRKNSAVIKSWLPFMGQTTSFYLMATTNGTGAFYHSGVGSPKIYKDGVYTVNATPFTDQEWHLYTITKVNLSLWTAIRLSGYDSTWSCDGYFDDIRIYNTELSDADILNLYQTRASIDNRGNLFIPEATENTLNRCPNFNNWTLTGGATFDNGVLNIVSGGTATSPLIYIGLNTDWVFRADYFATEESNNVSFKPNAGCTVSSYYYNGSFEPTNNTENYSANGNAFTYPINSWSTRSWAYFGGNLVQYIKLSFALDPSYAQPSGFKVRNPMLTTKTYSGEFLPYSNNKVDNSEPTISFLSKQGVYRANQFSEMGIVNGLVGYYPFDKNARDYSGNGYHGTATGSTLGSGIKGGAYSFDGTASTYITLGIPSATFASLTSCSISFWIKESAVTHWLPFVGQTTGHYIMATSGGTGAFYHSIVGTPTAIYRDSVVGTTPIADTNWHHYVITGLDLSAWTSMKISGYGDPWWLEGLVDQLRIYNRILTQEEVFILYETTAPATAAMKITKDTVYLKGEFKEVI